MPRLKGAIFFSLQVHLRVGFSLVEYMGNTVFCLFKRAFEISRRGILMTKKVLRFEISDLEIF